MSRINVITGASGHIGVALIRELKANGERVRAIIRDEKCKQYLDADEYFLGDVTNIDSLMKAFEGAETVFHLAGVITIGSENKKNMRKVNIDGTKNVISACRVEKVKNLIYASTAHAIDFNSNTQILVEKERYEPQKVKGAYSKSKAIASNCVLEANSDTLRTVICMPTGVTGPFCYKLGNFSQFIIDFCNGKLNAYFEGGYDFVDCRNVAKSLYQAALKGRGGESYIISGEKMSIDKLLDSLSVITGKKRTKNKLPIVFLKSVAIFAEFYYWVRRVKPLFTAHSLYTLTSNCNFDNSKAKKELDLTPMSIIDSLRDEYEFLRKECPQSFKD